MIGHNLEGIKREVLQLYRSALSLREMVSNLTSGSSALMRAQAIFSAKEAQRYPENPGAYQTLTDHFWISYEGGRGFNCALKCVAPEDGDLEGRVALKLLPAIDKETGWLSLELRLPWLEVRPASQISVILFGKSSQACEGSIHTFGWDSDGTRHDLSTRAKFEISPDTWASRVDFDVSLKNHIHLDFQREPILVIFIDPKVSEFLIADLSIEFS